MARSIVERIPSTERIRRELAELQRRELVLSELLKVAERMERLTDRHSPAPAR